MSYKNIIRAAVIVSALASCTFANNSTTTDFSNNIARSEIKRLVLQLANATKQGDERKARYIRSMIKTQQQIISLSEE
jgi:hypothetical protein